MFLQTKIQIFFFLGCIVPSFMHRVYSRCTDHTDRNFHSRFIKRVLEHRSQDMALINGRFADFHVRRKRSLTVSRKSPSFVFATSVTFDEVSKVHLFTKRCIIRSYEHVRLDSPPIVFSSFPKLGTKISTKRTVFGKVKLVINRGLEQCII